MEPRTCYNYCWLSRYFCRQARTAPNITKNKKIGRGPAVSDPLWKGIIEDLSYKKRKTFKSFASQLSKKYRLKSTLFVWTNMGFFFLLLNSKTRFFSHVIFSLLFLFVVSFYFAFLFAFFKFYLSSYSYIDIICLRLFELLSFTVFLFIYFYFSSFPYCQASSFLLLLLSCHY